jgi:drug/metabolite transporter (DMT)-like permease
MYHEPSEGKKSEGRKDYIASSLLISLTLMTIVLLEIFDPKMGSSTMFSLERPYPLPLIALTALRPNSRELRQGRVRFVILLVAGVILMFIGFMFLPLRVPLIPMNGASPQTRDVLSLILIIGGLFVMLLGFYADRAESRWYYMAHPRASFLLFAGAILMFMGLVFLLLIRMHSTSPQTMEEQTPLVVLALILIIAGIFAMALGAYIYRAESRRGPYISPESPRKK